MRAELDVSSQCITTRPLGYGHWIKCLNIHTYTFFFPCGWFHVFQ